VKSHAPHVPWGRKRIREKKVSEEEEKARSETAEPERREFRGELACATQYAATEEKETMNKQPKMGRPKLPKSEFRGVFVSTRLSPLEYQEVAKAIRESGDAKTEWIRKKLLAAARRA
jgi:hypothetical protein